MYKVGEKVRFLNESVEGVVRAKHANDRLEIEDDFGFTRFASSQEVVAIGLVWNDSQVDQPSQELDVVPEPVVDPIGKRQEFIPFLQDEEALFVVAQLVQPTKVLTSDIRLWLANLSGFEIRFLMTRCNGELRSHPVTGDLAHGQELELGVFTQDQLHLVESLEFQFLLFRSEPFRVRMPLVKTLDLRRTDWIKAVGNPTLDNCLTFPLLVFREEQVDISDLLKRFSHGEEKIRERESVRQKRKSEFTVLNKERVIDLHFEELTKDTAGWTPALMIAHQLEVFEREMDRALVDHLHRITFIHGVGSGLLRSAIREELKKYDNIRFSDAPPEKYGNGATQVDFQ